MKSLEDICAQENHSIDICNFIEGQEVSYSVVVIVGKVCTNVPCASDNKLEVKRINGPWHTSAFHNYEVKPNSKFKIILRLEHGTNKFLLKCCSKQLNFSLHFRPRQTPYCVLPVYIICKGHDGRFQAPEDEDNSIDSACDRIDTGLRLLQSLIAERLHIGGYGRQTFQLQTDTDPIAPDCHVFYSDVSVEEAYTTPTKILWARLGREIMASHLGKDTRKFVGFLSCTYYEGKKFDKIPSYDDILSCTKGHVALGGGGLALFGSACLHTWASSVEEVIPRFLCTNPVDNLLFMDDSHYRGTYGGCFATTLGAVCHELGHTFDLGHTQYGLMGAEYHNIHHMFLPEEEDTRNRVFYRDKSAENAQPTELLTQDLWNTNKEGTHLSCQTVLNQAELDNFKTDSQDLQEEDEKFPSLFEQNFKKELSCQDQIVPSASQNLKKNKNSPEMFLPNLKVDWTCPNKAVTSASPNPNDCQNSTEILKPNLRIDWNCPQQKVAYASQNFHQGSTALGIFKQELRENWNCPKQAIAMESKTSHEVKKESEFMNVQELRGKCTSHDETDTFTPKFSIPSLDALTSTSDYILQKSSLDFQALDLTCLQDKDSNSNVPAAKSPNDSQLGTSTIDEQDSSLSQTSKQTCIDENEDVLSYADRFDPVYDLDDTSPFWTQSCLVLLAYNKWMNPRGALQKDGMILYDRHRKLISSHLGMQVVEVRDKDSKSILHWKFDQIGGLTKFSIPENLHFPDLSTIVVVDSAGNVLKDTIVLPKLKPNNFETLLTKG